MQEHIQKVLTQPETVTNWWPTVVLFIVWVFREILGWMKTKNGNGKDEGLYKAIDNQTKLIDSMNRSVSRMAVIMDLFAANITQKKDNQ